MPLPRAIRAAPLAACIFLLPSTTPAQQVFINEFHYDNASTDVGEFVEIAGPAGTELSNYQLVFYNGANGTEYKTVDLSGTLGGDGVLSFPIPGIQNGGPDGVAFYDTATTTVVQFLSYEGAFTASDGPANGQTSTDIGVRETSGAPAGSSLQLTGTGSEYADFSWTGPVTDSPGTVNSGQTFSGGAGPAITLRFSPDRICEIDGAGASTGTLTLRPAPPSTVSIALENSDPSEIGLPGSVSVTASGTATFPIDAEANHEIDGVRRVTVTASDPLAVYAADTADIVVTDGDGAPGTGVSMRLATINVLNGVGSTGTGDFVALAQILKRIDADVIAFQEVDDDDGFARLKALLETIGFGTTRMFLGTEGDAFVGGSYAGGGFPSGQNIAIASRWPILETAQIGRGMADRKEITRYPLFVHIDVPGTENDPAIVAVHFKAGNRRVDHFRKAIEAWRVREFLQERGFRGQCDNLFVVGDVNEDWDNFQPASFFTGIDTSNPGFADGSRFPQSYQLGSDIADANGITIPFADFPILAFQGIDLGILPTLDARNAGSRTFIPFGDARLDYIMAGNRHAGAPSEIYNSALDLAFAGLPKSGSPLSGATSTTASDHFLVFADFDLDTVPALHFVLTPDGGTVTATPAPADGERVTIALTLSGPASIVLPASVTLTGPQNQIDFDAILRQDIGTSPDGSVTVTASAPGYSRAHGTLALSNPAPSGLLLFSQYIETASGNSPKSVELLNHSGEDIDFAATPLILYSYFNGTAIRDERVYLDRGTLAGS